MTKLAAIYERKGAVFVSAAHKTKAGFWIDDDEVQCLDRPQAVELGDAVEAALARSRDGVATPPPAARVKPLLHAAGVRSWRTFVNGTTHADVSLNGGEYKITPYRNLGAKDGFEPQREVVVPAPFSTEFLGKALMVELDRTVSG